MAHRFELSVVMATYNRAATIRETLRHLADQELDPSRYEVIVVDDGSPDDTRQVAEEWLARAPFRMRYLHHANHGPGYTQNRGLEVAEAPIVLLMADDIFMTRDALAAHLRMHQAHPEEQAAVLGNVVESPKLDQTVFLRTWASFGFDKFAVGKTQVPYYRFWACNISAKRDFVMRHGGFREHRGRGGAAAHEDPELGYRLHNAGMRIFFCAEALGHHYHPVTFEGACKRRYMQGINFGEFRSYVPEPEIPVAYHILDRSTVGDHFRALFGPRRVYLEPHLRNPFMLLLRHLMHRTIFNRLMVRAIWEPLLHGAETNKFLASRVTGGMYRHVLYHHFYRGIQDGNRNLGGVSRTTGAALQNGPG